MCYTIWLMHSYILIGEGVQREKYLDDWTKREGLQKIIFEIRKIEESRDLMNFVSTKMDKVILVLNDFNKATNEAQISLLKTLEEPSGQTIFVLGVDSENNMAETIKSRCQIIRLKRVSLSSTKNVNFLDRSIGERLSVVSRIRAREEGIELCKNLSRQIDSLVAKADNKKTSLAIQIILTTSQALSKNGNVALHLTCLSIKTPKISTS